MKKDNLKFKQNRNKGTKDRMSFSEDQPFGHKVLNPKNQYKRKPKYNKLDWNDE